MQDLIKAALAPDVTPRAFFFEHMPKIHEARLEDFARASEIPIIVSVWFEDTDRRFTFELSPQGYRVEEGDMIDFPQFTITGREADWDAVKEDLLEAALTMSEHEDHFERTYGEQRVTHAIRDAFEALRGNIDVRVTGGNVPIAMKVILNDYEPEPGAPSFGVETTKDVVLRMARGELKPQQAQPHVTISGRMQFPLEIAGFFSKHFDVE